MKFILSISIVALIITGVFLFAHPAMAVISTGGGGGGGTSGTSGTNTGGTSTCVPGPTQVTTKTSAPFRCNDFSVYKCQNNACGNDGGAMQQGTEWYTCITTTAYWNDGCNQGSTSNTQISGGPYGPGNVHTYGQVPAYRVCPASGNSWSTTPPVPQCSGACYPAPQIKSLDDMSLDPSNVTDNNGDYKLPINFGWQDNVEKEVSQAPSSCSVGSYDFNIVSPSISKTVIGDELQTTGESPYKLECQLETDTDYQWRVRACLDSSASDCGDWSTNGSFHTSPAPEPTSPYDPDWTGSKIAANATDVLKWCPISGTGSYFLDIYKKGDTSNPVLPQRILGSSSYDDNANWQVLKNGIPYQWQVIACPASDTPKKECSVSSQPWTFIIGQGLKVPTNLYPAEGSAVNLSTTLSWTGDRYAAGYLLNVQGGGINKNFQVTGLNEGTSDFALNKIWSDWLETDTLYTWKVASCSGSGTNLQCGDETTGIIQWSQPDTFLTAGASPTNVQFNPSGPQGQVSFPLTVSWDNMPAAASYSVEIPDVNFSKVITDPKITIDFTAPYFQQGKSYPISIKTCADDSGTVCGKSAPEQFTVVNLNPPVINNPTAGSTEHIPTVGVQSNEIFGANAYQYQLLYKTADSGETSACKSKAGSTVEAIFNTNSGSLPAYCDGQYSIRGRGCIDPSCSVNQGLGDWGSYSTFTIKDRSGGTGLVPCGQSANNPSTPWDDRAPCQAKDIFLLAKVIIDFLMFKLVPAIIVLMTILTGVIFYTSLGQMMTMARVISLWKAVGIGLGIIFLAWLGVNFFLGFVGFNVTAFGHWYQLP